MRGTIWKLGAAVVMMSSALMGCGGPLKYAIHGTAKSPELDAAIVAVVNKEGVFTTLKVNIEHLAPPDRLGSGGKTYVAWSKDDKGKWHRIGALSYDEATRKASLDGASAPDSAFDLQITIERNATPEAPAGEVLLWQHVN